MQFRHEVQALSWKTAIRDPLRFPVPDADSAVAMKLPRRYLLSGDALTVEKWWQRFEHLLCVPDALLQLRCVQDSPAELKQRVARARDLCRHKNRMMLLNGQVSLARSLDLDGVHLNARTLMSLTSRPLPPEQLVGASCHNARELRHAEKIAVDFACLSPLFPTRSHPGANFLGLGAFSELVSACQIPVYALGGIDAGDLQRVNAAGGYGIAGISAWW